MKKFLVLLVLLTGAYFGLKKWSPGTLDKISFWKKKPVEVAQLPPVEPAPTPAPKDAPAAPSTTIAGNPATPGTPAPASAPGPVDKAAQVVVLCYHRIEGSAGGALSIEPALFEQHMQRLKDSGISVISMQDFLAWRRSEKTIPARSAIITIDDGYVSTYEVARPILKKFGYPWTCFVYTKYVASGGKSISWEQLKELAAEGVEIGSHTISHINLRTTPGIKPEQLDAWLREEVITSKRTIEERMGVKVATFAYPEGSYSPRVLELVKEAGYAAAFTVFGQRVTHGGQADRVGRYSWNSRRPQDMEMAFRFIGPLIGIDPVEHTAPVAGGAQ